MCDGRLEHTAIAAPAAATVVQACLLMSQNMTLQTAFLVTVRHTA